MVYLSASFMIFICVSSNFSFVDANSALISAILAFFFSNNFRSRSNFLCFSSSFLFFASASFKVLLALFSAFSFSLPIFSTSFFCDSSSFFKAIVFPIRVFSLSISPLVLFFPYHILQFY